MVFLTLCGCLVILGSSYANLYPEHDPRRNLALGKPTSQIDTVDIVNAAGYWHNGTSHNAVDGNYMKDSENKTCIKTGYHHLTWWMVDLQDYYVISHIVIFAVEKGFRVQNFSIEISMHKDNDTQQLLEPELCHKQLEEVPLRTRTVLPCQSETVGRFVRITKVRPNPSRLSLCQVEVYGSRTARYFSLQSRIGKRSKGRRLMTIQNCSPMECAMQCTRRLECSSFSVMELGTECELVTDDVIDIDENEEKAGAWTRYMLE